jgi:hypothetical protein
MAPLAFQHDPDGTYHDLAVQIRNLDMDVFIREGDGPSFEPVDDEEDNEENRTESRAESKTPVTLTSTRDDLPSRPATRTGSRSAPHTRLASPERKEDKVFRTQKEIITAWIEDPDHPASDACRYPLELYAQLNDSEFAYVSELLSIYDETRCFFLQWLLGKEIKELVNSARISAVQSGKPFTWVHARAETHPQEHD